VASNEYANVYAKKALHFGIGFKYLAVRGRIHAALTRALVSRVPETTGIRWDGIFERMIEIDLCFNVYIKLCTHIYIYIYI